MMSLQVVFDTADELQTNPVQTPAVFKPTKTSFWNTHTHTRGPRGGDLSAAEIEQQSPH